ncbi:MAG: hypothetical protein Q8Q07_01410, partial [Dehalococcoidales bacterium]|nr:hypothetical protein [Dehalococcoidales bacterium]
APELVPPLPELARAPEPVPPAPPPMVLTEDAKEKRGEVYKRAKLKGTIESQAADHPARLRALLEKVPESARPALLRAIAVSESGYERALESLED